MKFPTALIFFFVGFEATIADPKSKIHTKVSASLASSGSCNVVILMRERPLEAVAALKMPPGTSRGDRRDSVGQTLIKHAENSQKKVKSLLNSRKVEFKTFWITNEVFVPGATEADIQALANIENVVSIKQEGHARLADHKVQLEQPKKGARYKLGWGVDRVGAPYVWSKGFNGTGAIVATIDSGTRKSHWDLNPSYRKAYGWKDCTVARSSFIPKDDHGHGTQVLGLIVGANGTGVAPGAKWMTCKAFDSSGIATESQLKCCGQFMLCPTYPNGGFMNCSKAPHVINNSWFTFDHAPFFDEVIQMWNTAHPSITPVFSAGDEGSACSTITSPGDSAFNVFTVGAINQETKVPWWSSRGPVSTKTKPDIAVPGDNMHTTTNTGDGDCVVVSGTSFSASRFTGVYGLRQGQYNITSFSNAKHILIESASPTTPSGSTQNCGGTTDAGKINNFR